MRKVSVTRMELLAHEAKIKLANQGRELLEQKRTALMKELLQVADTVMERSDALKDAASVARLALARADAMEGPEVVRSTALASRAEFPLEVTTKTVMGLRVPHIEQKGVVRTPLGRGYSVVGTSIMIDEAASAFEVEVESIISLAESELRLTRLANEIERTSRRLNALEHLVIPRLEAERDFIRLALDERERSGVFRFKLVKRVLEGRRRGRQIPLDKLTSKDHQYA
jgi:V/A-type H+-transporting ATPase subunit D